jgi:hypothetical protein
MFDLENFRDYILSASDQILNLRDPIEVLIDMVKLYPQENNKTFYYLVGSGVAIELLTNIKRSHRDIDLVILDDKQQGRWSGFKIDTTSPDFFWCNMRLSTVFLTKSARNIVFKYGKSSKYAIWIVHPAILLIQKISNNKGLPPRPKDEQDSHNLIEYFMNKEACKDEWKNVIEYSLLSLPYEQRKLTFNRLRNIEVKYKLKLIL